MAQIRGTAGYNLGSQQPRFGGPGGYSNMKADATSDPSPLEQIRKQTSKIEDVLDTWSEPVKPYVYYNTRLEHWNRVGPSLDGYRKLIVVQISPSYWSLLNCGDLPRGRSENIDAVE
jgi:hypothetical protein